MVQTAARTDWDTIKEWNDKYVVRSGQARDICACCLWSWRTVRSTMPHEAHARERHGPRSGVAPSALREAGRSQGHASAARDLRGHRGRECERL